MWPPTTTSTDQRGARRRVRGAERCRRGELFCVAGSALLLVLLLRAMLLQLLLCSIQLLPALPISHDCPLRHAACLAGGIGAASSLFGGVPDLAREGAPLTLFRVHAALAAELRALQRRYRLPIIASKHLVLPGGKRWERVA